MDFKSKLASWQGASSTEKTASLMDVFTGAVSGGLLGGGGGGGGMPSPGDYIGQLLGAQSIGGMAKSLTGAPLNTYSYRINRSLNDGVGGLLDRVQADEQVAKALVGSAAGAVSEMAGGVLDKAVKTLQKNLIDSPKREAILAHLRKHDDIISNADMTSVLEAYSSMAKFAPKLSTNLSAAKSFLREAVQHDGGIDFMTVKGLAQAERAITGQNIGGS